MSTIANLTYLNNKINDVIANETVIADAIWREQDIDYKHKNEWINGNVKMFCCYQLVIEWFNSDREESYTYDEQLCEILTACKNEYRDGHGTRRFPTILYKPKQLLKFYIYKKCEILIDEFLL
jgi:hypothetical protein|tara:strand:+ start:374 stop:742 length:369 start_codon:yes stop_codon:yes gene_type:complete